MFDPLSLVIVLCVLMGRFCSKASLYGYVLEIIVYQVECPLVSTKTTLRWDATKIPRRYFDEIIVYRVKGLLAR